MSSSIQRTFTILNRLGFHLRPASLLARTAGQFDCRVTVRKGDREADGASLIALMTLEAMSGDQLDVLADGPDAGAALDAIEKLFSTKFGEDVDG